MRTPAHFPTIEPLEARIAPAAVVLLAQSYSKVTEVSGPHNIVVPQFVNTNGPYPSPQDAAIAAVVGPGNANESIYFIKLGPGDNLEFNIQNVGPKTIVNDTAGNVVAFFVDTNNSGNPTPTELSGLALGNKVSVATGVDVNGDVVTNYNDATGELGGTVGTNPMTETNGNAVNLLPSTITSLSIAGNLNGALISGGAVSHFSATNVNGILTGDAVFNATSGAGYIYNFDMGINAGGPGQTLTGGAAVVPATVKLAGPSLVNTALSTIGANAQINGGAVGTIWTGDGGPSGAGGNVTNLTLLDNTGGVVVQAGSGGTATGAVGSTLGGAGGSLTNILMNGPQSNTPDPSANSAIQFLAGVGGDGAGNGKGGAGGTASNIFVDYAGLNVNNPSASLLLDNVTVQGGTGGNGFSAGAGGSLTNIHVLTTTSYDGLSSQFQFTGGDGGSSSGGASGAGGSITNASLQDLASPTTDPNTGLPDDTQANSPTLTLGIIHAGTGGSDSGGGATGIGGAGGHIFNLTLKGFGFEVISGDGGSGVTSAGAGGYINTVSVLGSVQAALGDNIHTQDLLIHSGIGGDASNGAGAAGGVIYNITVSNANFGDPTLANGGFQLASGHGGMGGKGAGGAGGSMANVQVTGVDFATLSHPEGNSGLATVAAGKGGDGTSAGGAGGSITNFSLVGSRIEFSGNGMAPAGIIAGAGGSALTSGIGGAGGSLTNVAVSIANTEGLIPSDLPYTAPYYPAQVTSSSQILVDPNQNFVADGVTQNDTVVDLTQNTSTTVSSTPTTPTDQVALTDDIFFKGDQYAIYNSGNTLEATGIAGQSPILLNDTNTNFPAMAVTAGDVVENLSTSFTGIPNTAVVTAVDPGGTQLTLNGNIIVSPGDEFQVFSQGLMAAGGGGAGAATGAGGLGGSIHSSSINLPGNATLLAGSGGASGGTAANGGGGSLFTSSAFSAFGFASATAGDAGNAGTTIGKAGLGGSISGADLEAFGDITLHAGSGAAGGAGGGITTSGFSGQLQSTGFVPSSGNVTVTSGTGGPSATGVGGAGGAISSITGFISNGQVDNYNTSVTTQFVAGGGGNASGTHGGAGGAGGSISGIGIFGGGGSNVTFFMDAGDAGSSLSGTVGGTGGSISNIGGGAQASNAAVPGFTIDPATHFHHLSAGDGGSTLLAAGHGGKGGVGGSVSNVHVNGAIGQRTGSMFGFALNEMGGISAGAGATGPGGSGLAGNITNISADAIASIVAGHHLTNGAGNQLQATNLANKVDGIILNGTSAPQQEQYRFTLTFGGDTTTVLAGGDSVADVSDALNALTSIKNAGGVGVSKAPGGGYTVTFADNGNQANAPITGREQALVDVTELTVGNAVNSEVEEVTTLGLGGFTISYNGSSQSFPAHDTAADVQSGLQSLTGDNNLTVTNGLYGASNTSSPSTDYIVNFNQAGAQPVFTGKETIALNVVDNAGTANTPDSETISFPTAGRFDATQLAAANFVGGIANVQRPNSGAFAFTTTPPTSPGALATSSPPSNFVFGDYPVDGLIAATNLTANKNFTPEAFVTIASGSAVLVDNANS